MAMSNSNFGYQTPGFSSPYSSTPSNIRTQRPRFGYSGPSLYPRPRSSASKPNPDSFSDSMVNNYGNSNSRLDISFSTDNGNSSYDSYSQNSGSNYYSANESFYSNQTNEDTPSYMANDQNFLRNDTGALRCDTTSLQRDNSLMYSDYGGMVRNNDNDYGGLARTGYNNNPVMTQGGGYAARGSSHNSGGILPKPTSQFGTSSYSYSNSYGLSNSGNYKGNFKKPQSTTFGFGDSSNKAPFNRKFGKAKRKMTTPSTAQQIIYRCALCNLDFKSQIPYDMHLGGAKHAKKLKAKEALSVVQSQYTNSTGQGLGGEKSYFCDLCNVKANSLLQLHNHLEGSKHKSKLNPKEKTEEGQKDIESKEKKTNAKTNGSLTRPLPSEFGEPQPAKLTKFACETCGISVNSELQLQQHLTSKKHQNKVEGKPVIKKRKSNLENRSDMPMQETSNTAVPEESSKMVVGVKTLSSSFVQGETLQ